MLKFYKTFLDIITVTFLDDLTGLLMYIHSKFKNKIQEFFDFLPYLLYNILVNKLINF